MKAPLIAERGFFICCWYCCHRMATGLL